MNKIDMLKKRYSELIKHLKICKKEGFDLFRHIPEKPGYFRNLTTISLAILLELPQEDFQELIEFIKLDSIDKFTGALISKRVSGRELSEDFFYPVPYQFLWNALQTSNQSERDKYVHKYLDKYYKSLTGLVSYDAHLKQHKKVRFFNGYWSFELAACVKLYGWDDSSFKDNLYYPDKMLEM